MATHRFFIKQIDPASKEIEFPGDVAHQIRHVLRLKKGDCVIVMDGEGKAYQVELSRVDSGIATGKIIEVDDEDEHVEIFIE